MEFKETEHPEYSTLLDFVDKDNHSPERAGGISYSVETISLNDLLEQHNSPKEIDYLSIDTEGSELAILGKFDFEKYDVKIITVEHNYCEQERHQIHDLLEAKGFIRLFAPLSKFDDWYIKRSIVGL
jgi:hypothetical protein